MGDVTTYQALGSLTTQTSATDDALPTFNTAAEAYDMGINMLKTIQQYKTFLKTFPDQTAFKVAYNHLNNEYEQQYSLNSEKNKTLKDLQNYKKRLDFVNTIVTFTMAGVFILLGAISLYSAMSVEKPAKGDAKGDTKS